MRSYRPAPREPRAARPAARADPPAARMGSDRKSPADAGKQDAGTTAATGGMLRTRALGAATVYHRDAAVTTADWSYAKPRELLFLLAASPPMTKDQLGAALWPDLSRQRLKRAAYRPARAAPRTWRSRLGRVLRRLLPLQHRTRT